MREGCAWPLGAQLALSLSPFLKEHHLRKGNDNLAGDSLLGVRSSLAPTSTNTIRGSEVGVLKVVLGIEVVLFDGLEGRLAAACWLG
jgi:hypothetical protein